MEWDQISDKWVAMTKRLRNDCTTGPRTSDRLDTKGRVYKAGDRKLAETMPPEIAGGDRNLSSNE